MAVFSWIVVGAFVGYVTGLIFGQVDRRDVLINILIGIVGALLGGLILVIGGDRGVSSFTWGTYLAATTGAFLLVLLETFRPRK